MVIMARSEGIRFSRLASQANALLLLLVLVALGLVWTSPDLLHAHRSTGPGLYNAECPFAEIAARDRQESPPASRPAVPVAEIADVGATIVPAPLGARLQLHSGSRAPPLV
jgi:hypothetical protein